MQRLICQKSSHTHTHTVFWKTKPELIFFLSLPLCWDRPKSCSRLDNKHQMISHGTVIRSLRLLLVSVSNFYPDYKRPIRLFVSVQVSKATLTYTASTNQTPSPPHPLPPSCGLSTYDCWQCIHTVTERKENPLRFLPNQDRFLTRRDSVSTEKQNKSRQRRQKNAPSNTPDEFSSFCLHGCKPHHEKNRSARWVFTQT